MRQQDPHGNLAALTPEQRAALFDRLRSQRDPARPALAPIPRQPRGNGGFPLSFAQQRMWFLEQFEGKSALYTVPEAFRIRGALDVEALRRALRAIVGRHEVLRTTFPSTDGVPSQVIAGTGAVELLEVDLRGVPAAERGEAARRLALEEVHRPFDLATGPLFRTTLVRVGEDEHLLLMMLHHIIYDGWSTGVLLGELGALYDREAAGLPGALPEPPVQYVDFAVWQREQLQGEALERELAYWKRQLAGVPVLQLPLDRPRPAVQTHNGAAEVLQLPPHLTLALESLSQKEGCTLFMTLLAAFQTLLCHHTGQTDLPVGTLIANRTRSDIEGLLGFFVNTLVMRGELSGNPTFRELLRRVRDMALDAYTHQEVPFEKLVDVLQPERELSRSPLFQAMFVLQNTPPPMAKARAVTFSRWEIHTDLVKVDLSLEVIATPDGLVAELGYNKDLFDASTMARMLGHLSALLEAVVSNPDQRILQLPLLPPAERRQLLHAWNDTRADYPESACLHQLVEAQAGRTPEAIAVEFGERRLTYEELNARANQLAHHLRGLGVRPGELVGLCLHRSHELLVAALAILKAGGAYVPLDPEYPADRLAFVLEDSRVPVLVTQEQLLPRLGRHGARVVCIDRDQKLIASAPRVDPACAVTPEHLAYVLYTSGSTGKPKGVQVWHGAVVNFLHSMRQRPGLTGKDSLLAITTLSFDIAALELYLPLVVGARVIVASREEVTAGEQLLARLNACGATVMQATPSTWRMLIDAGWQGSPRLTVLCGGEALPRELADQLLARCAGLWNMYGPTEATIWITTGPVPPGSGPITLGRPIANMQVYVLNGALEPAPIGVAGELFLGGVGLARGYLHRPELTAERFVPHPFSEEPGARLYRTGDLARLLPDGSLEFLGRVDHQVKVRGYRIELGEIEAVLAEHPGVAATVVVAREDRPGSKQLVAYLLPKEKPAPTAEALRGFLKERLPDYMVPSTFMALETFPLTPNGKIDRRALPVPSRTDTAPYLAPRTPTEEALARIWAEILGLERVGVGSNFFSLGGDSLMVIRVVARANKAGLGLTTKQVFKYPTVAELAQVAGKTNILAEQGEVVGPVPFSTAQLWWLEMDMPRPPYYSIAFALEAREALDLAAAEQVVQTLVRYHDALRLRLEHENGVPRLVSDPFTGASLSRLDFSELPEAEQDAAVKQATFELLTTFDLEKGPLFKAAAIDLGPDRPARLLFSCHYLPADLESWQILLGDVDTLYGQLQRGEPLQLPPKGTSFQQWVQRLAEYARSGELKQEAGYWLSERFSRVPRLPLDGRGGPNTLGPCDVVAELLTVEETQALQKEVLKGSELVIDSALLSALVDAFEPWTGQRALLVNLLGHGRPPLFEDVDLSRTVGWLNVMYPAVVDLAGVTDPREAVKAANEQLRAIPKWGMGYGILRYLSPDAGLVDRLKGMPKTEIFFNYTGPRAWEYSRFKLAGASGGYVHDLEGLRPHLLAITGGIINDGQLELRWEYNENLHKRSTIEHLARRTMDALRNLIAQHRAARPR